MRPGPLGLRSILALGALMVPLAMSAPLARTGDPADDAIEAGTNYHDADGREWRDLNDTNGLSLLNTSGICPKDGITPCTGSLNGVSLTGWVWATSAQVRELFKEVTGLDSELDDDFHFEYHSAWAPLALSVLEPLPPLFPGLNLVAGETTDSADMRYVLFDMAEPLDTDANPDMIGVQSSPGGLWLFRVLNNPPVIDSAPDVTQEATGPSGAVVAYASPAATDVEDGSVPVSCSPASGELFALGDSSVTCTAIDSGGAQAQTSFAVHVVDTTPPAVSPLSDVIVEATSAAGATATFATPSAADLVDGSVDVTCVPASGSFFVIGDTLVTCTATDAAGNAGQSGFAVRVQDTTPPSMASPDDVVVPAASPAGAVVSYAAPVASDIVDGTVPVTCAPASGSLFSVGETTVTCTAADAAGNTAVTQFLVTVSAFVPRADLRVSLLPLVPQRQAAGDPVAYVATVHNAGPDAAGASLTVELQYREQAAWGAVPPAAAINGIFFMPLGQLPAGQTVQVPFEVIYQAFGTQTVSAVVTGGYTELAPADNAAFFNQVVDLSLDAPGVQTGGFDVPAAHVTDGVGLAVVGIRVPGALIAGAPDWDLFLPADLTSASLLTGNQFVPGQHFVAGSHFVPRDAFVSGDISLADPLDSFDPGDAFVAHSDFWLNGRAVVPAIADWNPGGRLLFRGGSGRGPTNLHVTHRGDTTLRIGHASSSQWDEGGLEVVAEGGSGDAVVGLCGQVFAAGLGHGDGAAFKCGSLTTDVLTGAIVVQLADGTLLDVPEGATVHIDEQATGGWHISVVAGSGVIATVGAASFTLHAGDTLDSASPGAANLPPVAHAGGPYLGAVNTSIALDGVASSDPNGDALSHAWSAAEGGSFDDAASPSPAFSAPAAGIYPVTLVVCDPSLACDTNQTSVVVYDPSAGFVTGGGWIDSPPGSCGPGAPDGVCAGDATGRANFGFVARYTRGANVPDGQTEFAFQAGNLRFHSDAYEWLVVSGQDRAQFKGTGSINGLGGFQFLLTAYDGADAGAPDGFRIKIWTGATLVYDNRAGADDLASQGNTLAISGGSIVIHTKK